MECFLQEEKEGVRVVVRDLWVCLVMFGVDACDFARVIRLEVLFIMGSRRSLGFAVPGPRGTCVCFVSLVFPSKLVRRGFLRPLFKNGLVSMWGGHGQ